MTVPGGIRPLLAFAPLLRVNGFAVAPEQVMGFVEAAGLLGPRGVEDLRRAAVAMMAVGPERREAFDALFDAHFLGTALPVAGPAADDAVAEAHEGTGQTDEVPEDPADDQGVQATAAERLGHRVPEGAPERALDRLRRDGAARLPQRRARRWVRARGGPAPDLRRALREAVRRDGEVLTLPLRRRRMQPRRIVLMIDVSGSMAGRTDGALRLAHALAQVAGRLEVFTLGTRLTRVSPALRHRDAGRALERAGALIADIDGGTRIGEAMAAFLSVPRYAGYARGAAVVVLSDGLERGGPEALIAAVRRLGMLAWRVDWLSPLAAAGVPQTEAMRAIGPMLDRLGDGATTGAVVRHLLNMTDNRVEGERPWR